MRRELFVAALVLLGTASCADSGVQAPVFIDTGDLEKMIETRTESDLKIFDCSVNDDSLLSYHKAHLPSAQFIDLNYFRNMTNKYPFMLPGQQQFIDTMKINGIKKSTRVVVYDTGNSYYATRVYWMLRTYGHVNASVLNGGFNKWAAEGRRIEST
jgi:thiosulfate/3-mercaptopyruvate sulfurtransferase